MYGARCVCAQSRHFALKYLDLSHCGLTNGGTDNSGVVALCTAVGTCATLEDLRLASNHLLPPGATVHAA